MTDNTTPHPAAVFRRRCPKGRTSPRKGYRR